MGAWGPGIFENDSACDVRDEYEALLGAHVPDREATQRVVDRFEDSPDEDELWLALAAAQWELGRQEPGVTTRALEVIDSGRGLRAWEGPRLADRKAALASLRAQLTAPQPSRQELGRGWRYRTDLHPGDVIAARLNERVAAVLRVIALVDDAPVLDVLAYEGSGFPAPDELGTLPHVPGFPLRSSIVHALKLREADADWREAGFELIASGDGISGERPSAMTITPWHVLLDALQKRFKAAGLA